MPAVQELEKTGATMIEGVIRQSSNRATINTARMFRDTVTTLIVLLVLLVTGSPLWAAKVSMRWAVLADSSDGSMRSLDFVGSPVVFSGTALQIYVEHLDNCHIYLYLLDSGQNLTPLYPDKSGFYDYGFPRGPKLIPPADQSFTFVPPAGIETLLLIGSVERLFQLEKLTQQFIENPDQMGQQKLLLSQIDTLLDSQEERSRKAEDIEKVSVKYKTAEGIQERRFEAVEVTISDFYGRRLRIDHR
jgi:hypothetical protein